MGYLPPLPNSSRLIDWGHSWVAPPPYPYAVSNTASFDILGSVTHPWDGNQWPNALRDALGIGSTGSYYKTYSVPSTFTASLGGSATVQKATTITTFLDYMPDDGLIGSVWYIPAGATAPTATNYRNFGFAYTNWSGNVQIGGFNTNSAGTNTTLTQGTAIRVFSVNDLTGINTAPGTPLGGSSYFSALRGVAGSGSQVNQELYWLSTPTALGVVDPGGTVIVRYDTRYRNYAVGGSQLLGPPGAAGNAQGGGWQTCLSWSPTSRPNATEVNVTATVSSGTTISCTALQFPIKSGAVLNFPGGSVTTTATGNFGATSLTVTTIGFTISAGQQGHVQYKNGLGTGAYETLSPSGINVWTHGVNDADNATQDVNAWIETSRACIAKNLCPAWDYPVEGNYATTNGSGGGAWAFLTIPAGGVLPYATSAVSTANQSLWSGTIGGSPTAVYHVGPAFEGGTIDLIVLGAAGTSVGVAGTITVDGATPPQGSVTIDTSSVSTSGLLSRTQTGCSTATSTTLTFPTNTITAADIGSLVTGTNIAPGSIITGGITATTCTLSQATTGTTGSLTMTIASWVPMVKRLTGLAAGAHTITLTLTTPTSGGANSAMIVYGLGLESQNPTTPVVWCGIARTPSQTSGQKTAALALNTASKAAIAGTATPLTGNTAHAPFGANVQYVDIDTLLGGGAVTTYFLPDGLHLNSEGHRLMARTLFSVIRNNFSPDQLIAR